MLGWQVGYLVSRKFEQANLWDSSAKVLQKLYSNGGNLNPRIIYRLGHAYFRLNEMGLAKQYIREAVQINSNNADWHYRLGFIQERLLEWEDALVSYNRAIAINSSKPEWYYRRSKVHGALQEPNEGLGDLLTANRMAPHISRYSDAILVKVEREGALWQKIRALEQGLASNSDRSSWHEQMGEIYFQMNRFEDSQSAFDKACQLAPANSLLWYRLGLSFEKTKDTQGAREAYLRAIALDDHLDSEQYGIGVFHEDRLDWLMAAKAYLVKFGERPNDEYLCARLASSYSKLYDWSHAEEYYRIAVTLNPGVPSWHYQLGFALERQGDMVAAASAYRHAVHIAEELQPYWNYRLGMVLLQSQQYQRACEYFDRFIGSENIEIVDEGVDKIGPSESDRAYVNSLLDGGSRVSINSRTPKQIAAIATLANQYGEYEFSIKARELVTRIASKHDPRHWHNLARSLVMANRFEDAAFAYREMLEIKAPYGISSEKMTKNKSLLKQMSYAEMLTDLEINDTTMLFESNHGASIGCNPYAMYQDVASNPKYNNYEFVWVLNDVTRAPKDIMDDPRVVLAPRGSQLYNRHLASAKYLVNNNTFPPYFTRRSEQRYLNTWHGTPIKTLGKDIPSSFLEHKNATRNFLQATDFIMPNRHTADILLDKYDVSGITSARVGLTGYPRNDRSLNISERERSSLYSRMGLDPQKLVVLYAPTWRGSLGKSKFDDNRLVDDLREIASEEYQIIFRGHQNTEHLLSEASLEATVVPVDIDTNALLGIVDVLITDYSSVCFDILSREKPIIFYTYDLDEYKIERGLYVEMESLPGTICSTIEEVRSCLSNPDVLLRSVDDDYLKSKDLYASLDDGKATRRAVDFFFGDDDEYLDTKPDSACKQTILFYQGSFIPNGIMIAFLSLLSMLPENEFNICIVVDPDQISKYPERLEQFNRLPKHVKVFAKVGGQLLTAEQRDVTAALWRNHDLNSAEEWELSRKSFQREFDHIFGAGTQFDTIVNYEGYVRYWEALFAFGGTPRRRVGYLHSDMNKEWRERFAHLECLFHLYSEFDSLISVGESSHEENMNTIADAFAVEKSAFAFVNNPLDLSRIVDGSLSILDETLASWCDQASELFVAVGRLSPEKDHAKLLRSFALVLAVEPLARLVLVGDGNLKSELMDLAFRLEIDEAVRFEGALINPYPLIARSDCFVFSSNYEGQGLAILEALVLERPVVSTDITGARGILGNGLGLLVDNSVEGLAGGMLEHFARRIPRVPFDSDAYQKQSNIDFRTKVLGAEIADE